ncbi:MAG: hypothetical protein MH252_14895 [Thermosynechococcaceae cyanobacterium MS004]|nr:hypothetical protein [Thermosynechococcaceae cyanobacterium MS004]
MSRTRGAGGKFIQTTDEKRQVRTIRVTDSIWELFGQYSEERGLTRADLLEQLIQGEEERHTVKVSSIVHELTEVRSAEILPDEASPATVDESKERQGEAIRLVTKSRNEIAPSPPQPSIARENKRPSQESLEPVDSVTKSVEVIAPSTIQGVVESQKPAQAKPSSASSRIDWRNYGWTKPQGAMKEHCFLRGKSKSLCRKWSYRETFLHNRASDLTSCRECWYKYGLIVEQSKATNPA